MIEEEALGFLRNYWGERSVLQRVFDPRGYDFYQARELSYAVDFLDAQRVRLLLSRGVPQRNIVVFASDGNDPAPDLAVLEDASERRFWLLAGTELGARLRPEVHLVDSHIEEVQHLPATRDALRTWFETNAAHLEPGSDLLLYVTDHGRKNAENLRNNALMLWGDELDVETLRELLRSAGWPCSSPG